MQTHTVPLKAGKVYTIDMVSGDVDSYLRLLDSKGLQLAEDDDSGGNLNAQIIFSCNKDGDYKIVCTTFGADGDGGSYVLTVKTSGTAAQPSSAHNLMLGKGAPDFTADFAVNSKPGKLSDLEGKIVVLDFFDVRNPECVKMQPKLSQWHKTYKDQDVVIVSVAYYLSEINKLEFDPETGGVKTVKTADPKSDQTLFKAFAEHHKIDHRFQVLTKQEADHAYNAYAVNGMPQVVVIDRKGMVRLIDVGGEKGTTTVEIMIKKLIAEK
jgi:hypothetical protein